MKQTMPGLLFKHARSMIVTIANPQRGHKFLSDGTNMIFINHKYNTRE